MQKVAIIVPIGSGFVISCSVRKGISEMYRSYCVNDKSAVHVNVYKFPAQYQLDLQHGMHQLDRWVKVAPNYLDCCFSNTAIYIVRDGETIKTVIFKHHRVQRAKIPVANLVGAGLLNLVGAEPPRRITAPPGWPLLTLPAVRERTRSICGPAPPCADDLGGPAPPCADDEPEKVRGDPPKEERRRNRPKVSSALWMALRHCPYFSNKSIYYFSSKITHTLVVWMYLTENQSKVHSYYGTNHILGKKTSRLISVRSGRGRISPLKFLKIKEHCLRRELIVAI